MTAIAPVPGRESGPASGSEAAAPVGDEILLTDTPVVRPPADPAAQSAWLVGVALALLADDEEESSAVAKVLAEAAGRPRVIEGAYGRAVALLSEFPGDPIVHRAVDLLAKSLLRSRRPERTAGEA